MVRKAQIEIKKELRGGKGEVEFHHILTREELNGHGSMYAMVRLKPGQELPDAEVTVQPMNLEKVFVALCGEEA